MSYPGTAKGNMNQSKWKPALIERLIEPGDDYCIESEMALRYNSTMQMSNRNRSANQVHTSE